MKNSLRKLGQTVRNRYAQAGVGVTSMLVMGAANATVEPTGGAAAIAALEAEASSMIDAAWPVAIVVVSGAIGIKLFKHFANRAS